MPSTYQITVNMSATTVSELLASGFVLCAMIPVQCWDKAALPVVWQGLESFSTITSLSWSPATLGYTSYTPLQSGTQVSIGYSVAMQLGQVFNIAAGGVGTVASHGIPGTISFINSVATPFTTGLALPVGGSPVAICAAPLYGNNIQCVAPTNQIFLMFSNQPLAAGEMIVYSTGPGFLANFATAQSLLVNYDIDSGWSWGGFAWGSAVPPLSNLQQLLVQQPSSELSQPRADGEG